MIEEGHVIPEFNLPVSGGGELSSTDLKGKITVLFLYPKDDTSGCTKESIGFTEMHETFKELGADIIGLSPDGVESHDKFIAKHNLSMPLIADEEKELIRALNAWVEKNMYGRKYMGVDRSTFLVDKEGKIAKIWRKVRVPGHVDKVLQAVRDLIESR